MTKLGLIAFVVLAIGCGKKDKLDKALDDFAGWRDKMCKCTDKACTEKTHEDYKKWEDQMEKDLKDIDKDKVDKSKMEKFEQIERAMKDCRRKYRDEGGAEGAPTAAPAGETPSPANP